jgi:hypothetical protein
MATFPIDKHQSLMSDGQGVIRLDHGLGDLGMNVVPVKQGGQPAVGDEILARERQGNTALEPSFAGLAVTDAFRADYLRRQGAQDYASKRGQALSERQRTLG